MVRLEHSNWGTKWDINGSVEVDVEDEDKLKLILTQRGGSCRGMQKIKGYVPELGFSWFYDELGMKLRVSINQLNKCHKMGRFWYTYPL